MTALDRTIYRRMKRSYTTKELIEAYTPTAEERRFVSTMTRTAQNQLNLMLWIKLFPCLGYFPALSAIPPAVVDHVRQALDLAAGIVPGYDHDRTLYRHHQVVREYYQLLPYGKEARRVILRTLLRAVRTMDSPADMINAALEELIRQRYEMPVNTEKIIFYCFCSFYLYPILHVSRRWVFPALRISSPSLFSRRDPSLAIPSYGSQG
jgi:hypothetical protein